jgi:hypothetical protein
VAAEMIVSDEAFTYLAVQRGRINDLRHDRAAWQGAYEASLAEDMADLEPWLPERCTAILDIGSGLGGIDVHLARHYIAPELWLLDGDAGLPPVIEAAVPFNDMSAARRFLGAHGIDLTGWITPAGHTGGRKPAAHSIDLVVSLQAWCFHLQPAAYINLVELLCRPGATLILDVRNGRPEWNRLLDERLEFIGVAREASKFTRRVYAAP